MLHTMRTKTKVAQNCLNYVLPNIVNETDALILEKIKTHSLHGYCTYIKQHYIKTINPVLLLIAIYVIKCKKHNCTMFLNVSHTICFLLESDN